MNLKLFDVHSHLQFAAYDEGRDEVTKRAAAAGVGMINVGTQVDTSKAALDLAHRFENVWATVGLHPIHTTRSYHDIKELGEGGRAFTSRGEKFDYNFYKKLAQDKKVVGIGECGLDYYRLDGGTEELQQQVFRQQIELSLDIGKPLMLHCRQAYDDMLKIVSDYPNVRGNVHFFAGDWQTAKKFLNLGFTLSFGGVLTFTHDYDEVVKNTPLGMILTETDAPYVAPVPHRGKRNEPAYVEYVVRRIAELKNLSFEEVASATCANGLRFVKMSGQ